MKILKKISPAICCFTILLMATSCVEDIDKSNRYTFTSETMADYLENRPEEFSSMAYIYKRAGMMNILQSYGTNTLFAPDNAAIAKYLHDQDSIYWESVNDPNPPIVETGIHSPLLEELSDSMIGVIARTHLVPAIYKKSDMKSGTELEVRNFNNYPIKTHDVFLEGGAYTIRLEGQAEIVKGDEEAVNGVIHTLDYVLTPPTKNVAELLETMAFMSIFSDALTKIGFADKLMEPYEDETYELGNLWAQSYNPSRGKTVRYPKYKQTKYTILAPTDEALKERHGIESIDDLIEVATEWYGNEDADDFTSEKNALNKLVRYHILPMGLSYEKLVMYEFKTDNFMASNGFIPGVDRYDYYTTMQGTLIKLKVPLTKGSKFPGYNKIWINMSNKESAVNPKMSKFIDVRLYNIEKDEIDGVAAGSDRYNDYGYNILANEKPTNGYIHPTDGLLIYNEDEMGGNVLYERIRIDIASLLPEVMTNDVRWTSKKAAETQHDGMPEYVIPNDFSKNLKIYNTETSLHYLGPNGGTCNLFGDEFIATGQYDFGYKLPCIPTGNYEFRLGYTATYMRSITQFYIIEDGVQEICGIPVDLRIKAFDPRIGWESDFETLDVESTDRAMRNRGYIKGPEFYTLYPDTYHEMSTGVWVTYEDHLKILQEQGLSSSFISARHYAGAIRYIVCSRRFDSNKEYWLRMKNVMSDKTKEGMHDYIEFVPTSIVNDNVNSEDKH